MRTSFLKFSTTFNYEPKALIRILADFEIEMFPLPPPPKERDFGIINFHLGISCKNITYEKFISVYFNVTQAKPGRQAMKRRG